MGVTRRIVFPAIRIILWAVIAVSLAALAFRGADLKTTDDSLTPTGGVVEPTVVIATGTVTNTVSVAASVVADPAVTVRATLDGTVEKLLATDGQTVEAETPVLQILKSEPREPITTTDATTGEQKVTPQPPKLTRVTIKAPVAGTLSMTTLKDQAVSVGGTIASVSPGSLSVTGTLTAAQQYRLIGAPTEASVSLNGGPAPFTCTGLRIGAAAVDPGAAPPDGSTTTSTGTVTCAIPPGVVAFAGLGASIEIVNGQAVDAVVAPVTAIQGSVQSGNVWVRQPDGTSVETPVTLGLTDGENVQVVAGLAAGQEILQFIPVPGGASGVDCADPAQYDPRVCSP